MKDVKSKDENTDEEKNDGELTNEDAPEALDTANSRFQFVGEHYPNLYRRDENSVLNMF